MQSASASDRLRLTGERAWERAQRSVGGGLFWSAVLALLLSYAIARSTVTAAWIGGMDVITLVAVGAAVFMALLALSPVPSALALGAGAVLAPIVAIMAAAPSIHAAYPHDPADPRLIGIWSARIASGQAASDSSFYLVLICLLMFVTGAWLSWCVLRWRNPMLGLIPGVAAFATNVLNFPTDQNGYTLGILVLMLGLLLWSTYSGSLATASHARVKLSGDARWDFWESGLLAMAALVLLGVLLPPLTTTDQTVRAESSLFSSWAELQQRLNHHAGVGTGPGVAGTTGFSADVALGDKLQRSPEVVFTYTYTGATGPLYFRGLDMTVTAQGEWSFPFKGSNVGLPIGKNQAVPYSIQYQNLLPASVTVDMLTAPNAFPDLLFYPGVLEQVNRQSVAVEAPLPQPEAGGLTTIDMLAAVNPGSSSGKYTVVTRFSTATAAQLRAAGTNYPAWAGQYASLPANGYRSPDVLQRIHALALQIVSDAGAQTPYDEASAIEAYLRGPLFAYSLDVTSPPAGEDRLAYFLFTSHTGYCEYFATAMGDMLRSLGIPTRLVNGFGPGQYSATLGQNVVREQDAHTWVESFFPGYGWIPFEPTNDNVYTTISRGASDVSTCTRENGCPQPGTNPGGITLPNPGGRGNLEAGGPGVGTAALSIRRLDSATLTKIAAVLLAILLLVAVALIQYLRPRTVMAVWKRTIALAGLAGAESRAGETPLEYGRRLQDAFPEAAEAVGALAGGFVVAAYAAPEVAASARFTVMDAWTELRPALLRRALTRLRHPRGRRL